MDSKERQTTEAIINTVLAGGGHLNLHGLRYSGKTTLLLNQCVDASLQCDYNTFYLDLARCNRVELLRMREELASSSSNVNAYTMLYREMHNRRSEFHSDSRPAYFDFKVELEDIFNDIVMILARKNQGKVTLLLDNAEASERLPSLCNSLFLMCPTLLVITATWDKAVNRSKERAIQNINLDIAAQQEIEYIVQSSVLTEKDVRGLLQSGYNTNMIMSVMGSYDCGNLEDIEMKLKLRAAYEFHSWTNTYNITRLEVLVLQLVYDNHISLYSTAIREYIHKELGEPVDVPALQNGIKRLYTSGFITSTKAKDAKLTWPAMIGCIRGQK